MHTPTPFTLNGPPVSGEVRGNAESKKAVIFSHGFGVRRDSRGMFTDLVERLGDDYLCVLFDYVDVNETGDTIVHPWSHQVKMLDEVVSWIREQYQPEEVIIVAHSQGCVIAGLAAPANITKIVLNASPTTPTTLERMRRVFGHRTGTVIRDEGTSIITRADGSRTMIPPTFWPDTKGINIPKLFSTLAQKTPVIVISAKEDEILRSSENPMDKNDPAIT